MRHENHKKAKRLQQSRGKVLKANPLLKNAKPTTAKNTIAVFVASMMGLTGALAVQQSSIASVSTSGSQNLSNLDIATSSNVQNSLSGSTPLSNSNSYYSVADSQNTSFSSTAAENNFVAVSNAESKAAQSIQTNIESCATEGIGAAVKQNLDLQMTVWGRPIDINKMFSPQSSGGCFADIGKIIDLSVTIPSLDTIINAAQQMVVDYATKKACDAMKSASAQVVGPINDVIGQINQAGQYTDVSGALGQVLNKELGKIDEGLVLPSGAFEGGSSVNLYSTPTTNSAIKSSSTSNTSTGSNAVQSGGSVTQSIKDFFS